MSSGSTRLAMAWARSCGGVDRAAGAGRGDAHALEHQRRLVLGDRVLEGDVARGEPHLVVAGLVLEAGLVAGVRLVQAAAEVGDGGAADVLVEDLLRSRG